jgi:hypothetical protein
MRGSTARSAPEAAVATQGVDATPDVLGGVFLH